MKRASVTPTVATWLIVATLGTPYGYAAITHEWPVVSSYVDGFLRWQADTGFKANVTNNAALTAGTSACTGFDGTVRFTGVLDEIRIADPTLLPPVFHCADATRSGDVSAADALAILQRAVSLPVTPLCPVEI